MSNHLEPELRIQFPPANVGGTVVFSRTLKKKVTKKPKVGGICIGELPNYSADDMGINRACKNVIDSLPQFCGRESRGVKIPYYVLLRQKIEYSPTVEMEYIDRLILSWQAFDMDDPHIKSAGITVQIKLYFNTSNSVL